VEAVSAYEEFLFISRPYTELFQPKTSWAAIARSNCKRNALMESMNRTTIASTVLLLALGSVLSSCSRPPATVALPGTISTVVAGYPSALQVKNQMDREANLTTVIVDCDRQGKEFQVPQISYGFAVPGTNGRVFAVTVDNIKSEAFAAMDAPTSPDSPYMSARSLPPLDLSTIAKDISGILEIAKTNGLDEFCSLASPEHGKVDLRLSNSSTGPVWLVIGDGWDDKGSVADLSIAIDARTGAVLSHKLEKAINRQ
jgi:hypothetical protein